MPKTKKRRTKKYKPRALKVPPMVLDYWEELSEGERHNLDLAGFVALDTIRRGEGEIKNCQDVCLAIQSGYIAAQRFGAEWKVKALMLIAYCGVQLAANYLKKGRKVDAWMLEPAQAALEVVADMEAQCTRRELGENIQETIRHVDKICRFDPEALWTVAPDYARNAHRDDLEPVKAVEGRRALTFMHGSPVIGYVVDDEECGRVIWREPKTETNLPITGPVLCLLASPDEEPWAWRKTNS
mgnify:FL=1|nr:MAG TPA: hypothetical protein [Caudoviricetes sp.]